MEKSPAPSRVQYQYFTTIQTRWMDNDTYGHVNNVVYYSFFDTAVNLFLGEAGMVRTSIRRPIGLVVDTQCAYYSPISFPDCVVVGVAVASIGHSSVCYDVAVFSGDAPVASARGRFVHVYVDPDSRRPDALPEDFRRVLEQALIKRVP